MIGLSSSFTGALRKPLSHPGLGVGLGHWAAISEGQVFCKQEVLMFFLSFFFSFFLFFFFGYYPFDPTTAHFMSLLLFEQEQESPFPKVKSSLESASMSLRFKPLHHYTSKRDRKTADFAPKWVKVEVST